MSAEEIKSVLNNQINQIKTPKPLSSNIPPQIIPQKNLLTPSPTPQPTPEQNPQMNIKHSRNVLETENKIIKNDSDPFNKTQYKEKPKSIMSSSSHQDLFSKTQTGFNPLYHVPPKYDIYGYLRPIEKRKIDMSKYLDKLNKNEVKIPWPTNNTNLTGAKTRDELLKLRKKEKIPDISYDLDKDGYVGSRDFVIAKRFDADNDGKLNEIEKKNAYEALNKKIEENYIWNLDAQGGCRPLRLLQKRGKFIDAEDFLPIRDTYPIHPLTEKMPRCATYTDLKKSRKNENIKEINEKMSNWEKKHLTELYYAKKNIEGDCNKANIHPKYSSINDIKSDKKKEAREKCGLLPESTDNRNNTKNPPSLKYVYNPIHKTKGDIDNEFHKENLEELKKISENKHKTDVERLDLREDEIFSNLYGEENINRKTFTKVKEQRKKETNDYNMKMFSKQTLGVHGHELPKFAKSKTMTEFWKHIDENYCPEPKFQSQCEYLESIKYYKPPGEELYLNEHRDEDTKWVDPFKREYHPLPKKKTEEDIIPNLTNINFWKEFDPNVVNPGDYSNKKKHIYRWTSLVNQFAPNKFKKGRFFDVLPESKNQIAKDDGFKDVNFLSNYMKEAQFSKTNRKKNAKKNEGNLSSEREINNRPIKDFLYQKYAFKKPSKNLINNKNNLLRTKGF